MGTVTCATCRYAGKVAGGALAGVQVIGSKTVSCRRYPPQIATAAAGGNLQVFPVFVTVNADDWCGEHVPRVAS